MTIAVIRPAVGETTYARGQAVIRMGENTAEAARQAARAEEAAAEALASASALVEWYQPDYTLNTDSGYYRANNGTFVASASYGNITFPLTGDELGLRVTVTLGGSAMAGATYYNEGGTFISSELVGDSTTKTNFELSPPAGAREVRVSGTDANPIILEQKRLIDVGLLKDQAAAAYRSPTRSDLQAAGSIGAEYGQTAEVYGHTVAGDSYARYVRGGQVYPTTNGWGLLASTATNAMAYGISSTVGETDPTLYGMEGLEPVLERSLNDFTEDYIELDGAGLHVLDYRAGPQIIYAETGAGLTREIECGHIPLNKRITIAHRTQTHDGQVVLDAGSGQEWADFDTRFLIVPTGLRVEFQRVSSSQFVVVQATSLNGNALSGTGAYTPTVRAASALGLGQSLIDQGFYRGASHGGFHNRAAQIGGAMPATVHWIDAAFGGSGLTERESAGSNYWVDMTDPANPADGPNLTAAKAVIASKGGDANQPAIAFGYIDLGQQLSGYIDSPEAPNASLPVSLAKDAFEYLFAEVRSAVGNASLPILVQPIGRRTVVLSTNTGRMQVVRELQKELVAEDANLHFGAETWDLTLRDSVHPDDASYRIAGERAADMVAKHVYSVTSGIYDHPNVTTASFNATRNSVDVTFTAGESGTRFYKPLDPWGFRVVNSSGAEIAIAKAYWTSISGNTATVRLFLDGSAAGGTLYHVWDYGPGFDPTRAIRTRSSEGSKSARPGKWAL